MTKEEKEIRKALYRQLIEFPPFQLLVQEMEADIIEMEKTIIGDMEDLRLADKGMIQGIRKALDTPAYAVNTKDENSEPS